MITHLHVENFKCLVDVSIDLAPFTILIGPNDSGKTSLLDAIGLLGRTTKEQLPQVFSGGESLQNLVTGKDLTRPVAWRVKGTAAAAKFEYAMVLSPGTGLVQTEELSLEGRLVLRTEDQARNQGQYTHFPLGKPPQRVGFHPAGTALNDAGQLPTREFSELQHVREALSSTVKYRLDPDALRSEGQVAPSPALTPSGNNLVAVIDDILTSPDREARLKLEEALAVAVPALAGVSTRSGQGGIKALEFTLPGKARPPVTIPAKLVSDGALLMTAFLALAYGNTPEIVFVEEPENGLHYSRLEAVIDLLRKMTTGEVGNQPRQVIITTHSPILLNFASPEEVRIFRRGPGGTQVTRMDTVPNIEGLLKEFATGELWFLLGEEELTKGARP